MKPKRRKEAGEPTVDIEVRATEYLLPAMETLCRQEVQFSVVPRGRGWSTLRVPAREAKRARSWLEYYRQSMRSVKEQPRPFSLGGPDSPTPRSTACPLCSFQAKNVHGLNIHIAKQHKQ